MKKAQLTAFIISALLFSSVEFGCRPTDTEKKVEQKDSVEKLSEKPNSTQLLNGIELNAKEVEVYRASLSLETGDLVPSNNTVALGDRISMTLNIINGWKEIDGKSFLGASEIITTDNGTTLLDTGDLFASNDEGLTASDAKLISLKARVTDSPAVPVEYYMVSFRVWDKKGNGEITGKYKFYIK